MGDPSPVPRPHGELQIDDNHGAGVDNGAHEPHAPLLSTAVVVDVGQEGNPEDDHGMPESTAEPVGSPLEEVLPVRLAGDLVQVGIVDNRSWVHVLLQGSIRKSGQGSPANVMGRNKGRRVEWLCGHSGKTGQQDVWKAVGNVLVECVEHNLSVSEEGPPSVHKQQPRQESELGKGKITRKNCRPSLTAADANTNVSRLDHSSVICTITDGKRDAPSVLHQLSDLSLLQWGHPAANNRVAQLAHEQEVLLVLRLEHNCKRSSLNDQAKLLIVPLVRLGLVNLHVDELPVLLLRYLAVTVDEHVVPEDDNRHNVRQEHR